MMKGFKNLQAWQIAMDVARHTKHETDGFPKSEQLGMISQMRRASVSIPSNVAEGSLRTSKKEFHRFIAMARGSCAELETLAILSVDFGYLTLDSELHAQIDRCSRVLNGLAASLRASKPTAASDQSGIQH